MIVLVLGSCVSEICEAVLKLGVAAENMMVTDVYTHVPQKFMGPACARLWYNIPSLRSAVPLWIAVNLSLFRIKERKLR